MNKFSKFIITLSSIFVLSACGTNRGIGGYSKDYSIALGKNPEKVLRTFGTWTKTAHLVNQWHSGTDAGPMIMYGVEGLVQYVRTTNTYYYLLAESINTDEQGNSIIKIRDNASWHDGTPFTAMDIVAYYSIDYQNDICKFIKKFEVVNDKTLKVYWKEYREPTDEAKLMLFAVDVKLGSVQYKEFKSYVDRALEIINGLEDVTEEDLDRDYSTNLVQPYGKKWTTIASSGMGEILSELRSYEPTWFVATGPYKLEKYTDTEMILVKNKNYYLDNSKAFDKIFVYQTPNNVNQIYSMISNGSIDYFDGCPIKESIEDILSQNESIVHYKMIDQNACGLYFNLEKSIWNNIKVREAFQYIFDRDRVREFSQNYGTTCWYPMLTVTEREAKHWMSPDAFNALPKFSYDLNKAEQLLKEAGWSKSGNSWKDENGNQVKLTLGVENTTLFVNMGQIIQSMLESFGITTNIKIGENWSTWFSLARKENSEMDFVVGVSAANSYTTHPYGFMRHFFDTLDAHVLHLPVSKVTNRWDVTLNRPDGEGTADLVDEIDKLYLVKGDELSLAVDNIVYGFAEKLYGVEMFENVTGSFFNADTVWGLPNLQELAKESRNITYIPEPNGDYFNEIADLNAYYTQGSVYGLGKIFPRD